MARAKDTLFFCSECGYESPKWSGQCPSCGAWNTMVEAPAAKPVKAAVHTTSGIPGLSGDSKPVTLSDVEVLTDERITTGMEEFDRVLGGGIVRGSLMLVGGDPGIGKSTLLTQVCRQLSDQGTDVLYITGEESLRQIRLRADRLGRFGGHMKVMAETDLDAVSRAVADMKPDVCVIDSIQTMYRPDIQGTPGSVGQIRESCGMLLRLAKGLGTSIFVVGHVTKEGVVAGPRMLEHMVDTVLYFEGDSQGAYRMLRGVKNRFGSTNEVGVFEMREDGLHEVRNPSEFMLMGRPEGASGSIVSCSIEGTRPIMLEIQALIAKTALANPRRSSTGIEYNRLNLLMAVLEKRVGFHMSECDAYVNVVGGMRVAETAIDIAVVIAVASGYLDYVVPSDIVALGEVGLSGEIRNVSQTEARIREAAKMGFKKCIVPASSAKSLKSVPGIEIIGAGYVKDAIRISRGR